MLVDGTTRLIVDLEAIAANYRILCQQAPRTAIAAVVKADAYGVGAVEVAGALIPHGCRSFFVNDLSAAQRLRDRFPDIEILVLHGLGGHPPALFAAQAITPVLSRIEEVRQVAMDATGPMPVGLGCETGLFRLGLNAADITAIAADDSLRARLDIRLIMTQLQFFADRAAPENRVQLARFHALRALLPPGGGAGRTSIATSSGLFMDPAFHLDLARPGSALFGLNPCRGAANPMRPAVRLVSRVHQIQSVPAGTAIGYEATYRCARDSRIAVFGAGFADGLMRAASNRAQVVIAGRRVPVVGRVSMSLTLADITDLPDSAVAPGASVEIFGPDLPADEAAALIGTTGQELLCQGGGLNPRYYLSAPDSTNAPSTK